MNQWKFTGETKTKQGNRIFYRAYYTCPVCFNEVSTKNRNTLPTKCFDCGTELKTIPTFIMLVGVAGSGKSTSGAYIASKEDMIIHSSDAIREELFGDAAEQKNAALVFKILEERVIEDLENNRSCIYDATNIFASRRREFLKKLPVCRKICIYVDRDVATCKRQNLSRERHVPEEVIERMAKSLEVPTLNEGWDKIIVFKPES